MAFPVVSQVPLSVVSVAGEPSVPMIPQSGAGDPDSGLNESMDTSQEVDQGEIVQDQIEEDGI